MQEKKLLDAIRDEYATANPGAVVEGGVINHFCEFANNWLLTKGVVGVGQTVDGFAIRFSDGSEYILAANTPTDVTPGAPVQITGQASRNQRTMPDTTRSVNITGR
jgi:hypothetical protein